MFGFGRKKPKITGDAIDRMLQDLKSAGAIGCVAHPETWKTWKTWNDARLNYPPGQIPMPGNIYGLGVFSDEEMEKDVINPLFNESKT